MTKLLQWLFGLVLILGPWTAVLNNSIESPWVLEHRKAILCFPIIFGVIFAIYAVFVVLYRTFNFNDCKDASEQLQKEIAQAQAELRIKGVLPRDPAECNGNTGITFNRSTQTMNIQDENNIRTHLLSNEQDLESFPPPRLNNVTYPEQQKETHSVSESIDEMESAETAHLFAAIIDKISTANQIVLAIESRMKLTKTDVKNIAAVCQSYQTSPYVHFMESIRST